MATAKELSTNIGRKASLALPDCTINVTVVIIDAKTSFGNDRYLVSPVSGDGSAWVSTSRINFTKHNQSQEKK